MERTAKFVYPDIHSLSQIIGIGSRIMSITTQPLSAETLYAMSSTAGRAELVEGELIRMSPAGFEHGSITLRLTWRIARHVEENNLGVVCAAETGFLIARNPDTVRASDLAFVTQARIDEIGSVKGYWPGCPEMVAEVVSPSDTDSEVQAKALAWIEAGCQVVWIVDPKQKHVVEFRSETAIRVFTVKDRLSAPDLFGDWTIDVAKLF